MEQQPLWVDSMEEALRACVVAAGGPKRVASAIWPAKGLQDAARYLNHCLDPERPEKLAPAEIEMVAQLGQKADCHTFMHYLAQRFGYEAPRQIEPDDEIVRLQRDYIASVRAQQQLAKRMEQMLNLRAL